MTDSEIYELNKALTGLRPDTVKRIKSLLINNVEPAVYEFKNCDLEGWQIDEFMDNYELENVTLYHDCWGEKIVLDLSRCKNLDTAMSAQTELMKMLKPLHKPRVSALGI